MDTAGSARQPHEELPCIWVLSGVLSYHLCDLDYACERCELYHALSGKARATCHRADGAQLPTAGPPGVASSAGQATSHVSYLLSGCRLYLDRPYRPPHFWLEETDVDVVTVGLDGALMRMLKPVRRVVSPGAGLHLDRDQPCGWIAREHHAVPLSMPIAGEVLETNAAYAGADEPCRLPEGDDWLFRVQPSEPLCDVPGLVRAEDTLAWYTDRLRTVKRAILDAVAGPAETAVGPVLADGGAPAPSLERVLGKQAFEDLIARIAHA